jgi:hypothetical protein
MSLFTSKIGGKNGKPKNEMPNAAARDNIRGRENKKKESNAARRERRKEKEKDEGKRKTKPPGD